MLIQLIAIALFMVFAFLAALHFYWAVGGKWGFAAALPTNLDGKRVLNPKKIDCALVGLGLLTFGTFYLCKVAWFTQDLPHWMMTTLSWLIPAIFMLRAIGDFSYVGFFKSLKGTNFAKLDTNIYSPLCLIISVFGLLIHLI